VKRPEWPSPHGCTSSISDELVLIQLLILVQSQRLSHTFFFRPALQQIFFFPPVDLPCSPNYHVQKKILTYPAPLPMLQISFSKLSFFLMSLSMLQLCYHLSSSLMFREELGIAATSRCEQCDVQYFQGDTKTRFVFYNFFCTCGFSMFSIWV
jgi:hypothetical protein